MFTGIVQGVAIIDAVDDHGELRSVRLSVPEGFATGIEIGASVAVDGVCLTVTAIPSPSSIDCDVMLQSLRVTTLAAFSPGAKVNVERAARDGAEIGGHPLSGHVDFTGRVLQVAASAHNKMLRIGVPPTSARYLFAKGYVAVNGASLTMSEVSRDEGWFEVWLIPETRRATTFDAKAVDDEVNVEIDRSTQVVVDTVRECVQETLGPFSAAIGALLADKGVDLESLLAARLPALPRGR